MSRWREHREAQREFEGDVAYEAWRRGMNPDRAVECASDCYWEGRTPEQCVDGYERRLERQRREREEEEAIYECPSQGESEVQS